MRDGIQNNLLWLLAAIVIAPARILLGTHSPKVKTNVA
jgi:hypothetical protein